MKSGFVLIVGRPNVGKSSLINKISRDDLQLATKVPGTTLKSTRVIYEDNNSQIVFIDTPGLSKPRTRLASHLNKSAYQYLEDCDIIIFCSPNNEEIGKGDRMIIKNLQNYSQPKIFLNTKSDLASKEKDIDQIFDKTLSVSTKDSLSITNLLETIKSYLEEGPAFFDQPGLDEDIEYKITEIIRGALITKFDDELPHSIYVTINEILQENVLKIFAHINIERDSQKPIILGKGGQNLKIISTQARKQLEEFFGEKVFLKLNIRTEKNWQESNKVLDEWGI